MGSMAREKKAYATSNASTTSDGDASGIAGAAPAVKRRASRAGTRCVSTLSSDQLTRKRANDREAQRAIRQRAKDHIEALERRIQELTEADGGDTAALVDAQERNRELERDLMELREKLRQTESPAPSFGEWSSDIEPSTTLNANDPYSSGSSSGRRGSYQYSSMPSARLGQPTVTDDAIHKQQFKLEQQSSNSLVQRPYGVPLPIQTNWNEQIPTASTAYDLGGTYATSMPSFVPLHTESPPIPEWQPSLRSWELPIKYLPPTGIVDSLLLNIIHEQRHHASAGTLPSTRMISPANMKGLLYSKEDTTHNTDPVSNAIAEILHGSEIPNLPEKAACLFVMHKLLCWQISPILETYERIPEWFSPRPSQLVEAHAMWISHIPWPKLRDKIIRNQLNYATEEFQELFNVSLSVNWPFHDIDILMFENGEVRVTPMFENHVTRLENWSLNAPFTSRYPELIDVCKFGSAGFEI